MRLDGQIEEPLRWRDEALAEERAAHLEHQVVVVLKPELQDALECPEGSGALAQLEERLPHAREAVFMIGIERERRLEPAPRPGVILAREVRIRGADVELDRIGVEGETFLQNAESVVVLPFVIELVGLFVEFFGASERIRHQPDLRRGRCFLRYGNARSAASTYSASMNG